MGLSYTFNGHAIARAANDLSLHTDVVRSVLDAYLAEELRAAGVSEHTTSVTFSDRADALFAVPREPTVAELAERLAKVEHAFVQNVIDSQHYKMLNDRIDKVTEIIGERVSGLVDQLEALATKAGSVEAEHSEKLDGHSRSLGRLLHLIFDEPPVEPAFPTGGASTAEAAADAVLPVPQRGDRVRLEGAHGNNGQPVPNGWYEVLGCDEKWRCVQVSVPKTGEHALTWLPWASFDFIKERRHADHT